MRNSERSKDIRENLRGDVKNSNSKKLLTLVAAWSVRGSGDHQSQVARHVVSTWVGDRLANIDL